MSSNPQPQLETWETVLGCARTINEVLELLCAAMRTLPAPPSSAFGCRPLRIHSRDDVEHWGRRLRDPAIGGEDPALDSLRALFAAAIEQMNRIGPRRGNGTGENPTLV